MPTLCNACATPLSGGGTAGICPACLLMGAQAATEEVTVLRRVGGYDLLERIGRGGMGVVYKAKQTALDRTVAVKMVSAGELAAPDMLRRFRLEAEAAARLQHPGIVGIYEVGEHDGLPYYSMEYVAGGRTLATLVAEKPMPPHAAAACLEKVARAVHHAHSHGVLHRDLKPSNILLDEQGEPRVADFGLARELGADSSLTISRNALGSPAYMPPEQAGGRSAEAGPSSDVYSLGAVLYHCLTGRPPFAGESVQTVLLQVREAEPVPPRRLNASIPRDLDTIVLKCLEKLPSRRYVSAAALADELSRFLRGEPVLARPLGRSGRIWRWMKRHPAAAALIAVSVLALSGGLAATLLVNRRLADGKKSVESALTEKSAALDGQTRALVDALISRAESAGRSTGVAGQRTAALEAIRQAVSLPLLPEERFRARNAALTALAMPEAHFRPQPQLPPPGDWTLALCDPNLRHYVVATFEGTVSVFDSASGAVQKTFDLSPRRIDCLLGTSEDGTLIAFRYDKTKLGVLHTAMGMTPLQAEPWPDPATFRPQQVTFAKWRFTLRQLGIPGGATVPLVCWPEPDGTIVMADPFAGIPLLRWKASPAETEPGAPSWTALQFSSDSKWLAAARGGRIEIRQMPHGETRDVHEMPAPVHCMRWVAWHERIAVGLSSGTVRIIEPFKREKYPVGLHHTFAGFGRPVVSVDFGGLGVLASSEDGTTKMWDRRPSGALFEFPAAAWQLESARHSMTAGPVIKGGMVGFLDFEASTVLDTRGIWFRDEATGPHCVFPNGAGIVLLHDKGVDFNSTGKVAPRNLVALDPVFCAAASPQSDWLLTGHRDKLSRLPVVWRGEQQEAVYPGKPAEILGGLRHVAALSLNASGDLIAIAEQGAHRVTVHPLSANATKVAPAIASAALSNPMACALSPDGKWVAAGSSVPLAAGVWAVSGGSQAAAFETAAAARNWHPAFSSDGKWLAVSGRTCHLFHPGTWAPGPPLDVPANGADHHGAAFFCSPQQPDRCLLAVVGADREVHLFRILNGPPASAEKLAILRLPEQSFVSLPAFDSRGKLTVSLPRAQLATWILGACLQQLKALDLAWPTAK